LTIPNISFDAVDGRARLTIRGKFPLQQAQSLWELATEAAGGTGDVLVELGEAEHLHVSAIQILLALAIETRRQSRTLQVLSCSDAARASFALAGLEHWASGETS